jgi:ribosomal protein S18 acetylase RimI-like enzyme
MNAGAPVVKLDWDSRHFGLGVARIPTGVLTRLELQAALDYCRSESVRCLYFLADSKDVDGWTRAIEAGFRPVDVRVDLDRSEPGAPVPSGEEEPADLATEAELPDLLRLARFAFTESRFYRDENFPPGKAEELFARWTERGVREPGFFTVIRWHERSPAGFLTGRLVDDGSGRIDLVAVSDELRGRGIGAQLLAAGLGEFRRRGCRAVSVATQGSNIAAQRLYQAHGFRTRSVDLWFHLWIK